MRFFRRGSVKLEKKVYGRGEAGGSIGAARAERLSELGGARKPAL
jgi:hypothetical protein